MATLHPPDDAPPSYETATGGSSTPPRLSMDERPSDAVPNGIPPERRRPMEDQSRPLPPVWIRQFGSEEQHEFVSDTKPNPRRPRWVLLYGDEECLSTLSREERGKHGG